MQATKHWERTLKAPHKIANMVQESQNKGLGEGTRGGTKERDTAKDCAPDAKGKATESQRRGHTIPANNEQKMGKNSQKRDNQSNPEENGLGG